MILTLLCLTGTAQCALLWLLWRTGRRLADAGRHPAPERASWPKTALIIPAGGSHPAMERALRSLLAQDHPDFIPIIATERADEPAALLALRLKEEFPALRHVAAGSADGCGQKNRNSLAGVAAADADTEILAFCDSTHLADPDFLRRLVAPLAAREAEFSTGYHQVTPGDDGPVTLAYALCVQMMRQLQGLTPAFTQLWGGAMAMRRESFESRGVADLWAANVVDDCSLSARLQKQGVPVRLRPDALLRTAAARHDAAVWRAWMDRQILFLKFCMPSQWLLLGLFLPLMLLPPILAALAAAGALMGLLPAENLLAAAVYGFLAGTALNGWRELLGLRFTPLRLWLAAFLRSGLMFSRVWLAGVPTMRISWQGIRYRVAWGGRVLGMERESRP